MIFHLCTVETILSHGRPDMGLSIKAARHSLEFKMAIDESGAEEGVVSAIEPIRERSYAGGSRIVETRLAGSKWRFAGKRGPGAMSIGFEASTESRA